jgi:alcohol dehydrogenase (cytochrome c)
MKPRPHACTAIAVLLVTGAASAHAAEDDWPSYNRTLTSERFAPLQQITRANVSGLHVICSYDTGQETGFQTGPIVIDDTMYLTTEFDTIAIDPGDCREKWRAKVEHEPSLLRVNRGVAFLDGSLFRGTQDGRVVAYDASDGRKLWETKIADVAKGETVPAAPIAWSGLVFVGNAGGDNYGVKGRMYALDAKTGDIEWEFYLVPKDHPTAATASGDRAAVKQTLAASWQNEADVPIAGGATWTSYTLDPERGLLYVPGGNPAPDFVREVRPGDNLFTNSVVVLDARSGDYRAHYQLVPEDFHDWDVASAPILFTAGSGKRILAAAPKDGHLYGFDLASGERLYKTPITTITNPTAPLTREGTRFCPGTQGGVEWNGPAYSTETGLVYTGAVDWCSTVRVADPDKVKSASVGQPWSGSADEQNLFGTMDSPDRWAGWLYASDAESGKTAWRFKAPAPLMSGVTPTAGGVVFFGDMAGNAYALDAENGDLLWKHHLGGAAGGGVITYTSAGRQRVAYAAGMTSPIWPTTKTTGKIVVLGIE